MKTTVSKTLPKYKGLTVFARKEITIDDYIKQYSPKAKKFDIQIYKDRTCKQSYARFMWYQRKPIMSSKTVTINCYKWRLIWIEVKVK